ncbi:MAG TPA: inositol monophosphatase family protein [Gemmatimonadaceae bacterium]|nr:inositol monophosphatase family protein [Gemmatimonadaceae bacterium]
MPSERLPSTDAPHARDVSLLHDIEAAAQAAAAFIRRHDALRAELTWEVKGDSDFVSRIDRGAEALIRDMLAPDGHPFTFIGEESAPDTAIGDGITYIVDPLDGTTNYLHGFPAYAVSIAALVDGVLAAGVVLDIPRNECFTAVRDGGAFRDGQPIHVSGITDPAMSLIATGVPFRKPDQIALYLAQLPKVLATTSGIRRAGSAALDLAHVACGRVDAFWELRLAPWDVAAGLLLVREAGGIVTDLQGAPSVPAFAGICAGNPAMHEWLITTIA